MKSQYQTAPIPEEIREEYREFAGGDFSLWHFPMMNDSIRNSAYDKALGAALKNGGTVLDIGSGSGLLAMMAARHGASKVITCEVIPSIARKAKEIIKANGYEDRIQVINKLSTDLVVGKDFPERADILVAEIFDDGLLGEYAFKAMEHAKANLLKPNPTLIPRGARSIMMCIESQEIFENHRVTQAAGFDVSKFNEFSVNNYTGYHLKKMNYKPLTAPKVVFDFDFYKTPFDESELFEIEIIASGQCHAIAYWFELQMEDQSIISTSPDLPQLSCWKQAVQVLEFPQNFVRGNRHKILAHHDSEAVWFTPG